MDLGNDFSSQIMSNNVDANFWLVNKLILGIERWTIVGKYPNEFENLNGLEGYLSFRLCVEVLSSNARMYPNVVTTRAVIFR